MIDIKKAANLVINKWNSGDMQDMQVYINKLEDSLKPSREECADYLDRWLRCDQVLSGEEQKYLDLTKEYLMEDK